MKKLKVGIVGCGTIGSALARFLIRKCKAQAELAFLCDHDSEKAAQLSRRLHKKVSVTALGHLISQSDLIIESAHASISAYVAHQALLKNKQVLIMSVGGLIQNEDWRQVARQSRGKLWIPSGALTGIDALLAAREEKIKSVKLVTRKPPESLKKAPYFSKQTFPVLKGNKEIRLFKGNAYQAVKAFPQNINVAAVVSLAGIGPKKTQVEIWTSKAFQRNQHDLYIEGNFGKIHTRVENVPSKQNPKTSALAILSGMATVKKIFSSIQIGT